MNKIYTSLIIIIINIFLFCEPVFAYKNFDECGKLKSLIKKNINKLSLEENYETTKKLFGFSVDDNYFITKVHPDLSDKLKENEQSLLLKDQITFINGKDISKSSIEDIEKEFNKEKIILKTNRTDEPLIISRDFITSEEVDLVVKLNKISEINSKLSYFEGQLYLKKLWRDERIILLGKSVYEEAFKLNPDDVKDSYFYCDNFNVFLNELNKNPPSIEISNLLKDNSFSQIDNNIEIAYFPPIFCEPKYEYFVNPCSLNESKNGSIRFVQKMIISGKFQQELSFESFPFDSQRIKFNFQTNGKIKVDTRDNGQDYTTFTDILFSEHASKKWTDSQQISVNEWKIINSGYSFDIMLDRMDADVTNIPTLTLFLDIERNHNYYIFKIIFPIFFILLITWSVFWISSKDLESRITVSTVCLLTLIAYNFIIDQNLPKLPYLTFIDNFILISYLFAGIPTIQSVVSKLLYQNKSENISLQFDIYCRFIIPSTYIITLLFVIIFHMSLF